MDLKQVLQSFTRQPLPHHVLMRLLESYKRPNDKIHELLKAGFLTSIKRGLYIVGPGLGGGRPETFLVANHVMGPSYVSLESALSFHGMIPEQVYEISSMTTKMSRKFTTPIGIFSYTKLPLPYYSFGIRSVSLSGIQDQYAMMASAEKALFDKIVTTPGVIFRSRRNAIAYCVDNLRIEEDNLKQLNTRSMTEWIAKAPKKESLTVMIKAIESL